METVSGTFRTVPSIAIRTGARMPNWRWCWLLLQTKTITIPDISVSFHPNMGGGRGAWGAFNLLATADLTSATCTLLPATTGNILIYINLNIEIASDKNVDQTVVIPYGGTPPPLIIRAKTTTILIYFWDAKNMFRKWEKSVNKSE